MIKPQQLDAFYLVMTTGSISAAARALRVSQPTASRLIRDLETEITLQLFTRRQGRVYPKAVANDLFETVKTHYNALNAIDDMIERLADRRNQSVGIAALPSFAGCVLPRALASSALTPMQYTVRTIENHDVVEFLDVNPEFLAISTDTVSDPKFETEIVIQAELVVAVPAEHLLAAKNVISVHDLTGIHLAKAEGAAGVFNQIDVVLERSGVAPLVKFRSNRSEVLYGMVETAKCCAIVEPFGYLRANRNAVVIRPFEIALPVVYRFFSLPFWRGKYEGEGLKSVIRRSAQDIMVEIRRACVPG